MRHQFESQVAPLAAGRRVIRLSGELDVAAVPQLEAVIETLCESEPDEVIVDLRGLEFIDSAGLAALLRGQHVCDRHGCRYALIRGERPAVVRLFEIAGLAEDLPFRPALALEGPRIDVPAGSRADALDG
jgi:anti-sigma B factor antagonist